MKIGKMVPSLRILIVKLLELEKHLFFSSGSPDSKIHCDAQNLFSAYSSVNKSLKQENHSNYLKLKQEKRSNYLKWIPSLVNSLEMGKNTKVFL